MDASLLLTAKVAASAGIGILIGLERKRSLTFIHQEKTGYLLEVPGNIQIS
jgi:hypothetical protein